MNCFAAVRILQHILGESEYTCKMVFSSFCKVVGITEQQVWYSDVYIAWSHFLFGLGSKQIRASQTMLLCKRYDGAWKGLSFDDLLDMRVNNEFI